MWTPGIGEMLILMVIVLVVFGGGKISGLGRSLGTAITEFKDAVSEKPSGPEAEGSPEPPKSDGNAEA